MPRLFKKLAILAKIETTYGVSAAPTGAADAMQMTDVAITPLAGDEVSRDLARPFLGHQGVLLVGNYARLEGSVEMAGAGAAGTAPAYGPLLRACGLSQTLTPGVKAEYAPVSGAFESVTLFVNLDGVNHAMLGARGNVSGELSPKGIPRLRFSLSGLLGPIADTALPAVTLTGFKAPLPVSKANTPTWSLHGFAAIAESLSFDLGNQVETRMLVAYEGVEIVDRKMTGSMVIEATSLAVKDWFAAATARTRGALSIVHGATAGAIVELAAPAVEIGRPTYGQTQGVANVTLPLMFVSSTTDDDVKLIVR